MTNDEPKMVTALTHHHFYLSSPHEVILNCAWLNSRKLTLNYRLENIEDDEGGVNIEEAQFSCCGK